MEERGRDVEESADDDGVTTPALDEELLATLRAATARSEAAMRRLTRDHNEENDLDHEPFDPETHNRPSVALGPAAAPPGAPLPSASSDLLAGEDSHGTRTAESTPSLQACVASELLRVDAVPRLLAAALYVLAAARFSDQDDSSLLADASFGTPDDDDDITACRTALVTWIARISRTAICIQSLRAESPDRLHDNRTLAERCIDIASRLGTLVASAARAVIVDEGDSHEQLATKWAGAALASIVVAGGVAPHDREAVAALQDL